MAGHGYNTYSGMESCSDADDGWSKSISHHVCRPVIIDAEGRKQPIIRYTGGTTLTPHSTAGGYVTKTETYVEEVHPPMQYTGQYGSCPSPTMVVLPPEDPYEFKKQQGKILRSPVQNRPQIVEEFITKVQTEASNQPIRTIPFGATPYRRPTGTGYTTTGYGDYNDYNNTVNNGGHNGYNHGEINGPDRARYRSKPPSEEFITKVQTEATNKPTRTIPFGGTPYRHPTTTAYGDYNDNNNNGGHNRAGYWSKSSSEETRLTKPTNDISTAIEYLKEAAKPFLGNNGTATTTATSTATPNVAKPFWGNNGTTTATTTTTTANYTKPRFTLGVPPRRSDYASTAPMETISSSEAKRRYGNPASLPFTTGEIDNYATTIDSREAMRKYNGRIV